MMLRGKGFGRAVRIARSTRISALSAVLVLSLTRCAFNWDVPPTDDVQDIDADAAALGDASNGDANSTRDVVVNDVGSEADVVDANLPIVAVDASCSKGVQCAEGSFCNYGDNDCGSGNKNGVCTSAAQCNADSGTDTVCACNGSVYPSTCAARHDGQDISLTGSCTAPVSTFRCGYVFCSTSDFCVDQTATPDAGPAAYSCSTFGGCIGGCLCSQTKSVCDAGVCTGLLSNYEVTCH